MFTKAYSVKNVMKRMNAVASYCKVDLKKKHLTKKEKEEMMLQKNLNNIKKRVISNTNLSFNNFSRFDLDKARNADRSHEYATKKITSMVFSHNQTDNRRSKSMKYKTLQNVSRNNFESKKRANSNLTEGKRHMKITLKNLLKSNKKHIPMYIPLKKETRSGNFSKAQTSFVNSTAYGKFFQTTR